MREDIRRAQLERWLHQTHPGAPLEVASADASFRRYFRTQIDGKSFILMDSPPDKEPTEPFIDVTERLQRAGVNVPAIIAQNPENGFLLIEDFGNTLYQHALTPDSVDGMYADALDTLRHIQRADTDGLNRYDAELLNTEMQLMPDWFLGEHLGISLSTSECQQLEQVFGVLAQSALEQPEVFVHRDFHSRNLMVTANNSPGVIDYQDAVRGPVTYDLVSLLRDCYIAWPLSAVYRWLEDYRLLLLKHGELSDKDVSQQDFRRWFDLMGLQRHIKVLGIFCRLYHRDGKDSYLDDLPLVLGYVLSVAQQYPEMKPLLALFDKYHISDRISPVFPPQG